MTFLELSSDAVVVVACIAAAIGCFVLSRRVQRLASTERGIGKAVSEMSRSVGQFEALLVAAEESTREASAILDEQLAEARRLVARLETLKGAALRAATDRSPAADPLADVVPKGAAAPTGQAAPAAATTNGAAHKRLADLAQQRARSAGAAASLRGGTRA